MFARLSVLRLEDARAVARIATFTAGAYVCQP